MLRNRVVACLLLPLLVVSCENQKTETIEDFDSSSYGQWSAKGTAFEDGPAGGEGEHHMLGYLGSGFVSSVHQGEEPATGTLTSPAFTIDKGAIHFMVGAHEIYFRQDSIKEKLSVQLLVNEKVVRSTTPDRFHAMFWESWDVSGLQGRKARIRIVDRDKRDWAHIDVDEIILTDLPPDGLKLERAIKVTGEKLNFPVKRGNQRYYIEIMNGNEALRGMDVALASPQDADYWVSADLSRWEGKELRLRTRQFGTYDPAILDGITLADSLITSGNLYEEALRPQFHFSARRGWLNDPNGLVYHQGEYHLFFQHNPYGRDHSRNDYNKTWGHAVSTDLVHWQQLPGAIHPDSLGSIYSGSAVVDEHHTTGFGEGREDPLVCLYTSAGTRSAWSLKEPFTQSIAYSNDGGRSFTKYKDNPVQQNIGYINRDPKAFWYEPDNRWVIVLHLNNRGMAFFTSRDLKDWKLQSVYENDQLVDCPELFQLPVDGDEQNKKWILYGGSGDYVIGDFNGEEFNPQSGVIPYSHGNCFYASQTFNNVPEQDGRRIQMAWGTVDAPGMPFNQMMLFPVELTLHSTPDGPRMFAWPVEEIQKLYSKTHVWQDLQLHPGASLFSGLKGKQLDIRAEFEIREADEFGFYLQGKKIAYNAEKQQLIAGGEKTALEPVDGTISLRVLVDRLSIEVFANQGRIYMPVGARSGKNNYRPQVFTRKGVTKINHLRVHRLKSIWNQQ